jgi:hypothetical protein
MLQRCFLLIWGTWMEKNLADAVEVADGRLIQDLKDSDQRRSQKEI